MTGVQATQAGLYIHRPQFWYYTLSCDKLPPTFVVMRVLMLYVSMRVMPSTASCQTCTG